MPKISDCDRCLLYARNPLIVCAVHPEGVDTEKCLDFRLNPEVEELEPWSPEGYSFYDGVLVKNPSRYTQEEQLEMLETHPYFTGFCPKCNHQFDLKNPPLVHWDCPSCGWVDDVRLV